MKFFKALVIISLACGFVALHGSFASAEWSWDLYLGGAFSVDEDVTVSGPGVGSTTLKLDYDHSPIFGARGGYWFERRPWLGVALDVSVFFPDIDGEEVTMVPISALVMFRTHLAKGKDYPTGRLQPYAGIGPGLFITDTNIQLANLPGFGLFGKHSDMSFDPGLDVRGGLKWRVFQDVMLFGEYRFTYAEPDFEDDVMGSEIKLEAKFLTHHVLFGISYPF